MFIKQIDSTNRWLRDNLPQEDGFFVWTDYQTAGRGQIGNHWESEDGKNILVSILIRPQELVVKKQFRLSMIASLSVVETLNTLCAPFLFQIKWPNDIYYKDKKIGGILIENILSGGKVSDCLFGLGLNINQTQFISDAPNPISLLQITGKEYDREAILAAIRFRLIELESLLGDAHYENLKEKYIHSLYRREGMYEYEDAQGPFQAVFKDIDEAGRIVLEDKDGKERTYLFKQLKYRM